MSDDKPYESQPPHLVADMLAMRAWDDDVDDDTRLLCEMAADTIRHLMRRCVRLSLHLERAEAMR